MGLFGWNPLADAQQLADDAAHALNALLPDYFVLCASRGSTSGNVGEGCLTIDKNGNVYVGGGGGKGAAGTSIAARGGWINGNPSPCQLEHFIEGPSASASAYIPVSGELGVSGAETWGNEGSFKSNSASTEVGVGAGSFSFETTQTYTWKWFHVPILGW